MKQNVKYKVLIAIAFLVILAAVIAAFFLTRSGNGGIQSAYDFNTTKTVTQVTKKGDTKTTTLPSGKKRVVIPGAYVSILNKYQDALNGKLRGQALLQNGVSPLLAEMYEGTPLENVGFYVDDFNGDGTTDLLIGVVDGYKHYPYAVLDYYTLDNNGKAFQVFQSDTKDYFSACTNARFLEKLTDSKNYTAWYFYGLNSNGMALTYKEGLLRDYSANKDKPWYRTDDLDGDTSNDKHVKNDVGTKRQKQLDNTRIKLNYITFAKYDRAKTAK